MSLKPAIIEPVPKETARIARAVFPKGNLYLSMRDELGTLFADADFAALYPTRGPACICPLAIGADNSDAVSGELV
jgi:transposase